MQTNNDDELDVPLELLTGSQVEDGILSLFLDGSDVELRGKAQDEQAARKELLERSLRQEAIELKATIRAYGQGGNFRNRKFTRFTPAALQQYARGAGSTLLQRNHSMSTEDTGGLILSAKVELNGDERVLVEEARLTHPWAVQDALMGTMRMFSIHWRPLSLDAVVCTVCKASAYGRQCMHWPGQRVETKAGNPEVVEFEYSDVEPVETSTVVFPAVVGTGVQRIAEQLSAIRARLRATSYPTRRPGMQLIATALGMSAESDEATLAAQARKLGADNAELQRSLAERDALIVKLRADAAAANKKALEQECSATVDKLLSEGKIRPGGEHERLIRDMFAQGNVDMAQRLAASFKDVPAIVPVGGWQSPGAGGAGAQLQAPPAGTDGKPNYKAIVDALPEHIRTGLTGMDPEVAVRANADFVRKTLGINVEAL